MYDNATEEIKDSKPKKDETFKLATVTGLFANGCPKLTFVGEETESTKEYPFLQGYAPEINDVVLCAKTNSTYIVVRKLCHGEAPKNSFEEQYIIDAIDNNEAVQTRLDDAIEYYINGEDSIVKTDSQGRIMRFSTNYYDCFNKIMCKNGNFERLSCNGKTPIPAIRIYEMGNQTYEDKAESCRQKINEIISNLKDFGLFY